MGSSSVLTRKWSTVLVILTMVYAAVPRHTSHDGVQNKNMISVSKRIERQVIDLNEKAQDAKDAVDNFEGKVLKAVKQSWNGFTSNMTAIRKSVFRSSCVGTGLEKTLELLQEVVDKVRTCIETSLVKSFNMLSNLYQLSSFATQSTVQAVTNTRDCTQKTDYKRMICLSRVALKNDLNIAEFVSKTRLLIGRVLFHLQVLPVTLKNCVTKGILTASFDVARFLPHTQKCDGQSREHTKKILSLNLAIPSAPKVSGSESEIDAFDKSVETSEANPHDLVQKIYRPLPIAVGFSSQRRALQSSVFESNDEIYNTTIVVTTEPSAPIEFTAYALVNETETTTMETLLSQSVSDFIAPESSRKATTQSLLSIDTTKSVNTEKQNIPTTGLLPAFTTTESTPVISKSSETTKVTNTSIPIELKSSSGTTQTSILESTTALNHKEPDTTTVLKQSSLTTESTTPVIHKLYDFIVSTTLAVPEVSNSITTLTTPSIGLEKSIIKATTEWIDPVKTISTQSSDTTESTANVNHQTLDTRQSSNLSNSTITVVSNQVEGLTEATPPYVSTERPESSLTETSLPSDPISSTSLANAGFDESKPLIETTRRFLPSETKTPQNPLSQKREEQPVYPVLDQIPVMVISY